MMPKTKRVRPAAPICAVDVVHLDALKRVRKSALDDDELAGLTSLFALLSNETRLRILLALSVEELCVCDLAQAVEQSVSATSHQLRSLRHQGLVRHRQEGKLVFYRLRDRRTVGLIERARKAVTK